MKTQILGKHLEHRTKVNGEHVEQRSRWRSASNKEGYKELGGNYFDEQNRQSIEKRLVRRLEKLSYQVELQPAPQVA